MNELKIDILGEREIIKFYRASGQYGFLSNLYKVQLEFEGRLFPTSEHAYQYGKFKEKVVAEWAMQSPKPHLLAILAHGLFAWDIVKNWSTLKLERMKNVVRAKFNQHPELANKLLETGDAILIENSKTDSYWGIGRKGNGKNMLGKILMETREFLAYLKENDRKET
jgi:ribA/ribD-fused uncharacterized protein